MNSKRFIHVLIVVMICLGGGNNTSGSQKTITKRIQSPNGRFELALSPTRERLVYTLSVLDRGRELTHFKFEGELVNSYWSPTEEYVAINNHSGYMGWYLWIISLADGSIVKADGKVKEPQYDRYIDADYAPNILDVAKDELQRVYPNFRADGMRVGCISIAQRWESNNRLLVFNECQFNELFEKENAAIWIQSAFDISENAIGVTPVSVRKVAGKWWKEYPTEIRDTLELRRSSK